MEVPGVDPVVLRDYKRSREARTALADISKWRGLTPEQSRTLDEFGREVRREHKRLSIESGARLDIDDVAEVMAEQRGIAGLATWFKAIQSERERRELRNPEYDAFIGLNQGLFEVFYPNLITLARLERLGIIEGAPSRGLSLR